MKKILLVLALSTMVFATSCKKEPQPIIINQSACTMEGLDSADVSIYLVDYKVQSGVDASGTVVSNSGVNTISLPIGANLKAISRSQGVALDSMSLVDVGATIQDSITLDEHGNYNFLSGNYPTIGKLKYDRYHTTTVEVWANNVLLGTVNLGSDGLSNPVRMNYIPNTSGIENNGGYSTIDVTLPDNNYYNQVCFRF